MRDDKKESGEMKRLAANRSFPFAKKSLLKGLRVSLPPVTAATKRESLSESFATALHSNSCRTFLFAIRDSEREREEELCRWFRMTGSVIGTFAKRARG